MADRDGILSRLTDGRVFKGVTSYFGRRILVPLRSYQLSNSRASTPYNSEVGYNNKQHESAISGCSASKTRQENESGPEPECGCRGQLEKVSSDLRYEAPQSLFSNHGKSFEEPGMQSPDLSRVPPLTSKISNIFTFKGEFGYEESALSLTEDMIFAWNIIFRSETKILEYKKKVGILEENQDQCKDMVHDLNRQLERSAENLGLTESELLHRIDEAKELEQSIELEIQKIEAKARGIYKDMEWAQRQLYQSWNNIMATHNLLDPAPEESFNGSLIEVDKERIEEILEPSKSKTQTPTPSEIARVGVLEAQEVAEDDRYHKQLILSNLQDEFEKWKYHYEEELRKYRLDVEDGIAELEMTAFDNFMLQEHQELSRNLTKAEKEFEEADDKAKALRIAQPANGYFQGSHSDRSLGYNSLDEGAWIAHVDRDFIHRWLHTIDKTEVGQVQVSDCDEWEVKTVELGDSISLVAEGIERKNINRWMSIQIRRNELVSLSSGDIFAES